MSHIQNKVRSSKTKGSSYFRVRETFKDYLSETITTPERFGLHSFRSGVRLAATNNDILDRQTSKQARWISEKARNGYIEDSVFKRLAVSNA